MKRTDTVVRNSNVLVCTSSNVAQNIISDLISDSNVQVSLR